MSKLLRRLLFLFRRSRFDRELEEEMQAHLEMKAQESGDPYRARREFGNPTLLKEESREAWCWRRSPARPCRLDTRGRTGWPSRARPAVGYRKATVTLP